MLPAAPRGLARRCDRPHRRSARIGRVIQTLSAGLGAALLALAAGAAPRPDTPAERLRACTACHGPEGRAAPDGYQPRIAGKPAAYLYQQLRHFRDGRRSHNAMATLLAPLSDTYLQEIAAHFAGLQLPYPPPASPPPPADAAARARVLLRDGDPARRLPACAACHGDALTGTLPAVPGLLGLPRDYLVAQLGAWRTGLRRAAAPDCMAEVARRLAPEDIAAVAGWLAAQPLPAATGPAAAPPAPLPLDCGALR